MKTEDKKLSKKLVRWLEIYQLTEVRERFSL